ncbi:hypothetical protein Tco_0384795 [Tanacetum coccineum]
MEWIQANSGPHVNDVALTGVSTGLQCIEIKEGNHEIQKLGNHKSGARGFEDFDRQAVNIYRITCSFAQAVNIDVTFPTYINGMGTSGAFVYSDCIPNACIGGIENNLLTDGCTTHNNNSVANLGSKGKTPIIVNVGFCLGG